jgi:hypothetical protein
LLRAILQTLSDKPLKPSLAILFDNDEWNKRVAALAHGINAVVKREENKVSELLAHLDVV